MSSKNKKGLFMSVELIVVIVIITLIVALVASGVFYLLSMQKRSNIVKEYTNIREAVYKFQIAYNTLPGLLSEQNLSGPFSNTTLKTDYTAIKSVVASKVTEDIGQSLAWKELYLNDKGSIPAAINVDYAVTPTAGSCKAYKTLIDNNAIPTAGFDKSLAWVLVSSNAHKGVVANPVRASSWPETKLRLMLIRYDALGTDGCLNIEGTDGIASLSPNEAYDLVSKTSASDPSAGTDIIAENFGTPASATAGCTTLTAAGSTAAEADLKAAKFNSSDDNSGKNGCVVHFAVSK